MIKIVNLNVAGNFVPMFLMDTDTGYTGIDVLTRPGVYSEVCTNGFSLPIIQLTGDISGHNTTCMMLVPYMQDPSNMRPMEDCTAEISKLLSMPAMAAKMVLNQYPPDTQTIMEKSLEVIHFYESVTTSTKVFLPDEAYVLLSSEDAAKMKTARPVYAIKSIDNQEITQSDCSSTFGVMLPDVADIRGSSPLVPSTLTMLRVLAPNRNVQNNGMIKYHGIYHTPYYRVDPKIRGVVPSCIKNINGLPKNDALDVMPFERHMYDNLYTMVCADTSRYVEAIANGLFFSSSCGQKIRKILSCQDEATLGEMIADLSIDKPAGFECNVSFADLVDVLDGSATSNAKKSGILCENITVTDDFWEGLCDTIEPATIVDTEWNPFTITVSDEMQSRLTSAFIAKSIVSRPMFDYLTGLCIAAYRVNWGHTGATQAIPHFVTTDGINLMDGLMASFLAQKNPKYSGKPVDFSALYNDMDAEAQREDEDEEASSDELYAAFTHYITNETMARINADMLSLDFFSSTATGAESVEASIIEYWRKVRGEQNLEFFLQNTFMTAGCIKVVIDSFIKLCRWGDNKPTMILHPAHKEIRTVFDLNTGREIPNTAIVDEADLKKVNGYTYKLERILTCSEVGGTRKSIVGFLLSKDYGIKKFYIASLVDVGHMVSANEMDILELGTVNKIDLDGEFVSDISEFEDAGYEFHISDKSRSDGVELNVNPSELNALSLLINPKVVRSAGYLRSKQNSEIVTLKDRQYKILERYIKAVLSIEGTSILELGPQTDSSTLCGVAQKVYVAFEGEPAVRTVNENRAAQALSTLNLGTQEPAVSAYKSDALAGKFVIISDVDMISGLPAIEFTDFQMIKVSQRLRNRIVLMLLDCGEYLLLCRKSIIASELKVTDQKIEHRKYANISRHVDALKEGKKVKIIYGSDQNARPLYLHESLKGFI